MVNKTRMILIKRVIANIQKSFKLRNEIRSIVDDAMIIDIELLEMYLTGLYNINAMFRLGESAEDVEMLLNLDVNAVKKLKFLKNL